MATPDSVPKVGIKLPPYTYSTQFELVAAAVAAAKSSEPGEGTVIDFLTCTNTLGSCLVLNEEGKPAVNSEAGTGIGGYVYLLPSAPSLAPLPMVLVSERAD
jgi:dihydroorotate dehydrogenase (fumarate)